MITLVAYVVEILSTFFSSVWPIFFDKSLWSQATEMSNVMSALMGLCVRMLSSLLVLQLNKLFKCRTKMNTFINLCSVELQWSDLCHLIFYFKNVMYVCMPCFKMVQGTGSLSSKLRTTWLGKCVCH